jgi:hypothetical protein
MSSSSFLTDTLHQATFLYRCSSLSAQAVSLLRFHWSWARFLLVSLCPAVDALLPLRLQHLAHAVFPVNVTSSSHPGFETLRCCLCSINFMQMDTYQVLSSNSRLIRCLSLSNSHTNDCPTCLQLLAFRMYCLEREEEKETSNFFFFLFHHLAHEDYVVDSVLLFCCCFWDRISLCSPGQPWIKFSLDSVYCDYRHDPPKLAKTGISY